MDLSAFKKAVSTGESETVEFKESFGEDALEAIGAFSNTRGGHLFIGIADNSSLKGVQIGKKTLEDIANRIQEATDPRLQPSIDTVKDEKKQIICIKVNTGKSPVSVRGRYFKRVGKTVQRMSHEEIIQRLTRAYGASWDSTVETNVTVDELDSAEIDRFLVLAKQSGRRTIPEGTTSIELLRKFELIEDGRPTRAALLLFGKNPENTAQSAFLKMGRFRSPTNIVDDQEAHGSLISQLESAMGWFKQRLETKLVISGKPQRDTLWEYPLNAIREAIINAVCHRDYTSDAHTQIRLYDDRLEIWNAGSLPTGLTPETLLKEHDSIPRNRKIAEAFYNAGFIERWGSGILRIASELKAADLPAPQFEISGERFKIIFYKDQYTEERLLKMGLTKRQIKAVAFAKERGSISNSEYQELVQVAKRTATRDLNQLISRDIFETSGIKGRGSSYKIKGP